MKAYVAGPLFDEGERWWIEEVEKVVEGAGFATFLPHRDNPTKNAGNVADIFANDRRGIDEVVNLMIECSLTTLVRSLDDLPDALQSCIQGSDSGAPLDTVSDREHSRNHRR